MKNLSVKLILILFITGFNACVDEPTYPDIPNIDFESITKTIVNQRTESLEITLQIEDGDGDIGTKDILPGNCDGCISTGPTSCVNDPAFSLFLIDPRDNCVKEFKLPYIEPEGQTNAISGSISVLVGNFSCKDPNNPVLYPTSIPYDTLYYDVFIKDRAGHFSDTVRTPFIIIRCI